MDAGFLATTVLICASPGTGVVYTLAAALARGRRAGLLAALAGTLGVVPHMVGAVAGLAALLHASALAFEIVRYAGVAYLLWMAVQTLRQRGALRMETAGTGAPPVGRVLRDGIVLNLLNPKLSVFFVAFLPQFIDPGRGDATVQMVWLSITFMLVTLAVFVAYALFAAAARDRVLARPAVLAWLRRGFAAAFGLLAVRLAFQER